MENFFTQQRERFYIIDGNAYINKAYFALPPLTTSYGLRINAVYGFTRILLKILKDKPDYLVVCLDFPAPTFRHKEFKDYKKTRKKMEEDLREQIPLLKGILKALRIKTYEIEGYEADDIIAAITEKVKQKDIDVTIISPDKDVLQLVDENVKIYDEFKGVEYSPEEVKRKYGVPPHSFVDYLSLIGDTTDNIPGIVGIGEKTARKLLEKYNCIEEVLKNLNNLDKKLKESIEPYAEQLLLNKRIIALKKDLPLDFSIFDCKLREPSYPELLKLFHKYEFKSLIKEIKVKAQQRGYIRLRKGEFDKLRGEISGSKKFSFTFFGRGGLPTHIGINEYYLEFKEFRQELKEIFSDPKILKIGHNIREILKIFPCDSSSFFDIMIAAYLLEPGRGDYSLESIAMRYADINLPRFSETPEYASSANFAMSKLHPILSSEIKEKGMETLFYQIEMRLIEVIADMEKTGVKIDIPYLKKLSVEFNDKMKKIGRDIFEIVGYELNLNSPQQLSFLLFEKLKLPIVKRTKTGYSTDHEVLKKLSMIHDVPRKILNYRELQKLTSTYVESLMKLADPLSWRVHTTFHQTATATGRISSSSPNLQNIPIKTELGRNLRRAFICEEGNVLISADYSQIELRVLAHISGDENLISAFEGGGDIHTSTACEIFGVEPEDVDENLRRVAKTINFGIIYGMSDYGLSQQLNISQAEAKEYIDRYFLKYPRVKRWRDEVRKKVHKDKFVTTLLGRRRYIEPSVGSSFFERVALNSPVQGSAADIIKIAMVNLHSKLKNTKTKMLIQVHDELLFESPKEEVNKVLPLIKQEMEKAYPLNVPLVVDIMVGKNWRDMERW